MYHSRNRASHHCKDMKQCCKSVLQWCEAKLHGNGNFPPPGGQ